LGVTGGVGPVHDCLVGGAFSCARAWWAGFWGYELRLGVFVGFELCEGGAQRIEARGRPKLVSFDEASDCGSDCGALVVGKINRRQWLGSRL
jgi:hypothetical protein